MPPSGDLSTCADCIQSANIGLGNEMTGTEKVIMRSKPILLPHDRGVSAPKEATDLLILRTGNNCNLSA